MDEKLGGVSKTSDLVREVSDRVRRKVDDLNKNCGELRVDMDKKLSSEEGRLIWANFQKFALYDDLRELYSKFMPAISGFEDKLSHAYSELKLFSVLLRRFDEVLCDKATRG